MEMVTSDVLFEHHLLLIVSHPTNQIFGLFVFKYLLKKYFFFAHKKYCVNIDFFFRIIFDLFDGVLVNF